MVLALRTVVKMRVPETRPLGIRAGFSFLRRRTAFRTKGSAEAQNILFIADTTEMREAMRQPVVVWER